MYSSLVALECPSCGDSFNAGVFCPKDGSRLAETGAESSRVGETVADRYRIIRLVGEGAMGEVFEAEHIHINKRVALKLLRSEVASDAVIVKRFQLEARTASAIGHRNIVQIEDFGIASDGTVFLAMEWLDGETLEAMLLRKRLDHSSALEIATDICAGLSAAHEAGIIHRDLKPANVIVSQSTGWQSVKILDFGIAKLSAGTSNLTSAGAVLGTPNFMAPEQAQDGEVDARADIYSLGVVLYQMFTGKLPFAAPTPMGVLHQHATTVPVTPEEVVAESGGHIPPDISSLIMRCLEKRPENRYDSAATLGSALRAISTGTQSDSKKTLDQVAQTAPDDSVDFRQFERRSPWFVILPILVIAALAAGAYVLLGSTSEAGDSALDASLEDAPNAREDASAGATQPQRDAGLVINLAESDAGAAAQLDAATPSLVDAGQAARAWSYSWKDKKGDYAATINPGLAKPGEAVQIELVIRPKDSSAKSMSAAVSFSHYQSHNPRRPETVSLRSDGAAVLSKTFSKRGKYHVTLDVTANDTGREILKTRFDICIGADPDGPSRQVSKICPSMN